jgi:FMN phosphatase YigB (HAD superfamily)
MNGFVKHAGATWWLLVLMTAVQTDLFAHLFDNRHAIIAHDANDTLLKPVSFRQGIALIPRACGIIVEYLKKAPGKLGAVKNLFLAGPHIIRSYQKKKCMDDALESLVTRYPDFKVVEDRLYKLVNSHAINPESAALVMALHDQGYTQVVATNMGARSWQVIQEKYPGFFANYFRYAFTSSEMAAQGTLKPNAAYYKALSERVALLAASKKRVILIDDKKENTDGAYHARADILGIPFKSAEQVLKSLQMRTIVPENVALKNARGDKSQMGG